MASGRPSIRLTIILRQLGTEEITGFWLSELCFCFLHHYFAKTILAWQRQTLSFVGIVSNSEGGLLRTTYLFLDVIPYFSYSYFLFF